MSKGMSKGMLKARPGARQAPDIFFLSYDETNREKNWHILKSRFPRSRRLHGLKGIGLAHQMCARLSESRFFFVVNGDNEILPDFKFELPRPLTEAVYAFRSLNPVNQLAYGFGAVKIFPREAVLSAGPFIDMSTSLKAPYQALPYMASVTRFNGSPLEAWRGAFRECAKLSSQSIDNQKPAETKRRLSAWLSKGEDQPFGRYALSGARQGSAFGQKNRHDPAALRRLNDFSFLERRFSSHFSQASGPGPKHAETLFLKPA